MQAQNIVGGNICLGKAGLTGISGAASTYTIAVAFVFSLLGKAFSKATAAAVASPAVDFVTGLAITLVANKGTVVLWCVDSGGTVRAVQGTTENLDASGNFATAAPQFPTLPDTLTPFAYTIHKAGATTVGTWTFGVSLWNATGMSHVVQDIIALPTRPQIA